MWLAITDAWLYGMMKAIDFVSWGVFLKCCRTKIRPPLVTIRATIALHVRRLSNADTVR